MLINSEQIVSMTEANQNFSKVVKQTEREGCIVIFKNNKPKFVLMDIEAMQLAGKNNERIEKLAKKRIAKDKIL
ncbi:MAG: type II toxin-antitoxin system Phd/YefM family antitoxin [Clostridia bacterium]|nr:type II toxin-antitoxin system Phd/YefM family antitoxin [Clostridia bacterium]MBQ7914223.1 type II toxin-antitoxin system Phd/YefM family antitoxin [Clostridia bacterium]MBQ9706924.1 type II toxin-antitoxin system Phd/YefM family antitoxin [Clostridia bacterium]MBR7176626.1 type II toxin-antitoxin system Phd/YefM family antitoxin [Clostridia bacterium]